MFITVKLKNAVLALAVILAVPLLLLIIGNADDRTETLANALSKHKSTLVIDPGHGGVDGGAVSASGIRESDINLSIAYKMGDIADFLGLDHIKTRDTDTDKLSDGEYSEHDNLVARAERCNAVSNAVLISIHQNEYPSEAVSGAEVMYAETFGSRELAESMQSLLVSWLDPQNRRVSRPAPKELLLTRTIECPGVLVECGFLSNPNEAEKLSDTGYQTKIAAVLVAAYVDFADTYYDTQVIT